MKTTNPSKEYLRQLFSNLKTKLPGEGGLNNFVDDLHARILAFIEESRKDRFVIRAEPLCTIKKIQAIGAALTNIKPSDVSDLWSQIGDVSSGKIHSQLLNDCKSKLKRDGFWRIKGKGEEIKHLQRCLKALDKKTSGCLWHHLSNLSPRELHQQRIENCQERIDFADTKENQRKALTDVVVGIAIDLSQLHLKINICTGDNASFVHFTTALAGLVFDLKLGPDNEYSEQTVRTWIRRYLRENYPKTTPE